jgi:hypothetical protein
VGALNPEQQAARELEVLAALRTLLTEMELARLIVLGLKSLDEQSRKGDLPRTAVSANEVEGGAAFD